MTNFKIPAFDDLVLLEIEISRLVFKEVRRSDNVIGMAEHVVYLICLKIIVIKMITIF